jgi:hypothetical protein
MTGEFRLEFHLFPLEDDRGDTLAIWNAFDSVASNALRLLSNASEK